MGVKHITRPHLWGNSDVAVSRYFALYFTQACWLVFGIYWGWDPGKPYGLGNTLIPWACVAILGYCFFAGIGGAVVVAR